MPVRRRVQRSRRLSLGQLLPNLITLGAICAGLTAIRFSIEGRIPEAVGLILLAAVLDGLDGRMARMLRSESAIGAELDSLADFLNFGVAVALLTYFSTLHGLSRLGWIAVLVYVICCVLRLARFNVGAKSDGPSPGFTGVPSPAGAMLALMPVAFDRAFPTLPELPGVLVALWLMGVALLMISRIPTPSLKLLRIPSDKMPYLLVLFVAAAGVLFTWPWETLVVLNAAYLCVVIWSVVKWQKTEVRDET
ncbi:CDP-diacylglycerol--serine O-phosphatidyltransferase [Falsirhodobacter xinxiangensis]|uniref:CDP-diacylglycerol--serine O-phosphatidyltransferase n=1 Tax=Falsirhodobacter xinxiangensis TaxID=2530049 RepID=UPI0010A9F5A7|nr:CDP-diacylglycerol--serine O-phosphatidyltransferase [Rhodobacter xinxiangensis]